MNRKIGCHINEIPANFIAHVTDIVMESPAVKVL